MRKQYDDVIIGNWVTTADGCVHTADADATRQLSRVSVGSVNWVLDANRQAYRLKNSGKLKKGHVETKYNLWRVSGTKNPHQMADKLCGTLYIVCYAERSKTEHDVRGVQENVWRVIIGAVHNACALHMLAGTD